MGHIGWSVTVNWQVPLCGSRITKYKPLSNLGIFRSELNGNLNVVLDSKAFTEVAAPFPPWRRHWMQWRCVVDTNVFWCSSCHRLHHRRISGCWPYSLTQTDTCVDTGVLTRSCPGVVDRWDDQRTVHDLHLRSTIQQTIRLPLVHDLSLRGPSASPKMSTKQQQEAQLLLR